MSIMFGTNKSIGKIFTHEEVKILRMLLNMRVDGFDDK